MDNLGKAEEVNIKWVQSDTSGAQPMSITGRMCKERERTIGMTDGERAWRAQYLRDQQLDPSEPIVPKGYEKARYNIIRRFYRYPLNKMEVMIQPVVGPGIARALRQTVGKYVLGTFAVLYMFYNYKYMHDNNWTREGGWKLSRSRPYMFPDDPNYPNWDRRSKGTDFAMCGFDKSRF